MNAIVKTEPQQKLMLLDYMADKYALRVEEFTKTVRATCGLSTATAEQVAAFLIVAKEYNLNPLTKEIYAFPGKGGGVVPIVSIDGWVNLVNSNPYCDGFEFAMEHDVNGKLVSCTCTMHRKDRKHPVSVTEYLSECKRQTDPWKMEHRMLRHKAMIQAARYAFGFAGIYDEDEGRTIAESGEAVDQGPRDAAPPRNVTPPKVIEHQPAEEHTPASETVAGPEDGTLSPTPAKTPPKETRVSEPHSQSGGIVPHKIVGGTYAGWADSYIMAIHSAGDPATVMAWVDANTAQLDKLAKGSPDHAAMVKAATAKHIEFLRKTAPKADPITSGPQPAPSGDMGGEDSPPTEKRTTGRAKASKKAPDFAKNYDGWLTWHLERLAEADTPELIEALFEGIDARWDELMPPDKETLAGARREAEGRLEQ